MVRVDFFPLNEGVYFVPVTRRIVCAGFCVFLKKKIPPEVRMIFSPPDGGNFVILMTTRIFFIENLLRAWKSNGASLTFSIWMDFIYTGRLRIPREY